MNVWVAVEDGLPTEFTFCEVQIICGCLAHGWYHPPAKDVWDGWIVRVLYHDEWECEVVMWRKTEAPLQTHPKIAAYQRENGP